MMRTTVSSLLLFGCLLVAAKALEPSQASDRLRDASGRSLRTRAETLAAESGTSSRRRTATPQAKSANASRSRPAPGDHPSARDAAVNKSTAVQRGRRSTAAPSESARQSPGIASEPKLPAILLQAPEVDHESDASLAPTMAAPERTQATPTETNDSSDAAELTFDNMNLDEPLDPPSPRQSDADADSAVADNASNDAAHDAADDRVAADGHAEQQPAAARGKSSRRVPQVVSVLNHQTAESSDPAAEAATQAEETANQPALELDADAPRASAEARPSRQSGVEPPAEVSAELESLRDRVRDVLAYYLERPDHVERRAPWGVMHCFIAYGVDTELLSSGRRVNAIAYLCWNGPCRGQRLLGVDKRGLVVHQGVGVQGHAGQFLAMLAQSKVKSDYPLRVAGRNFTVADVIRYEQETCEEKTELTFKLIGLSHYLDTNATWKNRAGQKWDLPKLIKEELAQPVVGAACGGTHRMMGFSYAVKKRERSGEPLDGQWLRARKYVDSYHEYTLKLQNADGSFSTNWYRGPGALGDQKRRLETSGHMLEWLVYSLPDDQLTDERVVRGVRFLSDMLWEEREHTWEVGPKGHALHALALYDERVFGGQPGRRRVELADRMTRQAR